jgi:hypothetical protein
MTETRNYCCCCCCYFAACEVALRRLLDFQFQLLTVLYAVRANRKYFLKEEALKVSACSTGSGEEKDVNCDVRSTGMNA